MNKHEWHDKVMTAGLGDAQALAIAGYLYFRHNKNTGDAFPGLDLMAEDLGVDESTVRRWVRKLENFGYAAHKRGGTGVSNRYYLTMPSATAIEAVAWADVSVDEALSAWAANGPATPRTVDTIMPTGEEIDAFFADINDFMADQVASPFADEIPAAEEPDPIMYEDVPDWAAEYDEPTPVQSFSDEPPFPEPERVLVAPGGVIFSDNPPF